jgi:hypothetical protein
MELSGQIHAPAVITRYQSCTVTCEGAKAGLNEFTER